MKLRVLVLLHGSTILIKIDFCGRSKEEVYSTLVSIIRNMVDVLLLRKRVEEEEKTNTGLNVLVIVLVALPYGIFLLYEVILYECKRMYFIQFFSSLDIWCDIKSLILM